MSWGYFLDLELSVPTQAWKQLQAIEGRALPAGWWGFAKAELEERFGAGPAFDAVTFKKVLGWFHDGQSSVKKIEETSGRTSIRLIALLDRGGDTQVARPIAAAFDAAAKVGGVGRIQLVNDGSYVGEPGVSVTIAEGTLSRERLSRDRGRADGLRAAIYPELNVDAYVSAAPARAVDRPTAREVPKKDAKKAPKKDAKKAPKKSAK